MGEATERIVAEATEAKSSLAADKAAAVADIQSNMADKLKSMGKELEDATAQNRTQSEQLSEAQRNIDKLKSEMGDWKVQLYTAIQQSEKHEKALASETEKLHEAEKTKASLESANAADAKKISQLQATIEQNKADASEATKASADEHAAQLKELSE